MNWTVFLQLWAGGIASLAVIAAAASAGMIFVRPRTQNLGQNIRLALWCLGFALIASLIVSSPIW